MAISREDAVAWSTRWRLVSAAAEHETRAQSPETRLSALLRLRALADVVAMRREPADERAVWDRFQALRLRLDRGDRRRDA
jgi:hypothetical protein